MLLSFYRNQSKWKWIATETLPVMKGVIVGMKKYISITKDEFCELTKTSKDCWMFRKNYVGPNPVFWKTEDGIVFFDNDNGEIHKFKIAEEYGEVWVSLRIYSDYSQVGSRVIWESSSWSLWSTWSEY